MDINKVFSELAQYEMIMNQAADMVDSLKDQIKGYMKENSLDILQGNEHTATYKTIRSTRFDSKALKTDNPGLYAMYSKPTSCQRFLFK